MKFNGKNAELSVNKNILTMGDGITQLEGVVVYAPNTEKIYVPMQTVRLIKSSGDSPTAITE